MGPIHTNRPLIDAVNAMSQLPEQILSWMAILVIGLIALWLAKWVAKNL